MTNAMVEAGLVSASLIIGLFGAPIWALGGMVGISLGWWVFVHQDRFVSRLKQSVAKSIGLFAVVLLAVVCAHFVAFGFGRVLHSMMGF